MSAAEDKPEEKHKTLINIGIGLSCALVIGIFIAIGWTVQQPDSNEMSDYEWQMYRDSVQAAQNAATYDYGYGYNYDDPGDRYDYGPGATERENDSLNREIRNGYVYSYQEDLLDHLDKESDNCARLINELRVAFKDTLDNAGVSRSTATSIAFFNNTDRDEALFTALFQYRELCEEYGEDAGLYDCLSYRNYFPLLEESDYGYIKGWDKYEFEQDPDAVLTYLEQMEMDLRYYENQLLWDMMY
jgi:hypothetical protein